MYFCKFSSLTSQILICLSWCLSGCYIEVCGLFLLYYPIFFPSIFQFVRMLHKHFHLTVQVFGLVGLVLPTFYFFFIDWNKELAEVGKLTGVGVRCLASWPIIPSVTCCC